LNEASVSNDRMTNRRRIHSPDHQIFQRKSVINTSLPNSEMSSLAYLYDHMQDLPTWFAQLTARQLKDIAGVMVQWTTATDNQGILPMEEIEKREVLRAVVMCEGSILKAARLLRMGKTTVYRKLMQWGYSVQNRVLIEQSPARSGTKATGGESL
jgi:transcriptional regulator of acetoin/glycerol metabolism